MRRFPDLPLLQAAIKAASLESAWYRGRGVAAADVGESRQSP
jgi:hypothetical protein